MVLSAFAALLTGCSTVQTSELSQVKSCGGDLSVDMKNPIILADCKIGGKVSGEATYGYLFGFIPLGEVKPWDAEDYAIYNACMNGDADFLVSPVFMTKRNDYFFWTGLSVSVTGRAGKYTDFRTVPYEKWQQMKMNEIKAMNTNFYEIKGIDSKKVNISLPAKKNTVSSLDSKIMKTTLKK